MNSLITYWTQITKTYQQPGLSANLYTELLQYYQQNHRHYHNLNHITALFHHLEQNTSDFPLTEAMCWAVFYHDIIYKTLRKDNEIKSAQLAQNRLSTLGVSPLIIQRVVDLVLATQHHKAPDQHLDIHYFLDADLAILGATPKQYQAYSQQIRREYWKVPAILYRRGRRKVLQHLLQKMPLYYTSSFQQQFEQQARLNLQWELDQL